MKWRLILPSLKWFRILNNLHVFSENSRLVQSLRHFSPVFKAVESIPTYQSRSDLSLEHLLANMSMLAFCWAIFTCQAVSRSWYCHKCTTSVLGTTGRLSLGKKETFWRETDFATALSREFFNSGLLRTFVILIWSHDPLGEGLKRWRDSHILYCLKPLYFRYVMKHPKDTCSIVLEMLFSRIPNSWGFLHFS